MKSLASLTALLTAACLAQSPRATLTPKSSDEALAVCPTADFEPQTLTPYSFAKATAISLWYAKTAAERGNEMNRATQESDNMFSLITAMMRIGKMATNDFYCAKRPLKLFATKTHNESIQSAAELMMVDYDAHIAIDERMNQILMQFGKIDQSELMDKISTLQVERGQRWADLVTPTALALMLLVDTKRTDDPNKTTRLIVTKAEKESLLKWLDEHFPELINGMYYKLFDNRKCSDE
jgi:hypothetical protein